MARSMVSAIVVALAAHLASAAVPRGIHRARVLKEPGELEDSYDYVIVGGGTAGLTVADRLTEDEDTTVLVVEYGILSDSENIKTVRGGFRGFDANFLFPTRSVPQANLNDRVIDVMAGKVVGGSSAVNAMMTIRGASGDYDRWGSFFSDSSEWSWEGMLPYFQKALTFVPPTEEVTEEAGIIYDTSYWGDTSGVYASWPSYQYPGTIMQVEAWKEVPGVEFPPDSGAGETGVFWYPQFMDPELGERSYARTGHYSNYDGERENYHLVTNSKVTRVVVEDGVATGVTFRTADDPEGNVTTVTATKEVIVSAGAVHTPQVLQLSGIGPSALLESAGIETVVDLPGVGQNFQDHPMLTARFTLNDFDASPTEMDANINGEFKEWADELWETNRTGPYTIATGNVAAWLSYPVISARYDEIATQLEEQDHAIYLPEGTDETVAAGYSAQMQSYAEAMRANHTAFYNQATVSGGSNGILVDLHPLSRGTINIDPENPEGSEPLVDYRALSNPLDVAVMADIIRFMRSFYMNNTVNAQWDPTEVQPGADVQTDEDMAAFLAQTLSPSEFHPTGTAAMLPKELGGVVDEQLRVYGVEGLRVVDASIMPTLVGANTCQTVYAIGEKAADIIKAASGSETPSRCKKKRSVD